MIQKDNLISRTFILEQIQKAIDESTDKNEIDQFKSFKDFIRVCPSVMSLDITEETSCEKNDGPYDKKAVYFVANREQYEEILGVKYENEEFVPTVIITGVVVHNDPNRKVCGALVFPVKNDPVTISYEYIEEIKSSDGDVIYKILIPDET